MVTMLGLKDTMLQVLLALFPALLLGIGYSQRDGERKPESGLGFSMNQRLVLLCGISCILCILFSFPMESFYMFDMRIVPYAVGVLYGGYVSGLLLTLLYFGLRVATLGGGLAFVVFIALHSILVPVFFLYKNKFQAADARGKIIIAVGLQGFGWLMTSAGLAYRKWQAPTELSAEFYLFLICFCVLQLVSVAVVIHLVENLRERQRLQHELKEMSVKHRSEAFKLQQLIDAIPVSIIAIDGKQTVTLINDTMMSFFPHLNKKNLLGTQYSYISEVFGKDHEQSLMIQALEGKYIRSQVQTFQERTFVTSSFPIKLEDQRITGAVMVSMETTELIRLRKEIGHIEQLSLVGQMAASITHEIRNPMAVIRGFVQLMQEKKMVSNEQYLEIMLEELDRANGIIDDFLSLAQNRVVPMEYCDLHAIIRQLEPLVLAEANLRGHTLRLELSPELSPLLLNAKEIKQLLLNLLRNGMEAMEEKGVLTITTRELEEEVELQVSDTGKGIPEEVRRKLFEPFFTTKTRGTGLGLAVCLSIVERHHGRITVDSNPGKGSAITILFPKRNKEALSGP
jgi:signal transduction histidine kinase